MSGFAGRVLRALFLVAFATGMAVATLPARAQDEPADILRGILGELLKGGGESPEQSQSPGDDQRSQTERGNGQAQLDRPARRVPQSESEIKYSFAPLVKQTAPAVVNVYAARTVRQRSPFAGDPFFERFFGGGGFEGPPRVQQSLGSGVIVDPAGYIVTNNHVIEDADEVKIAFSDGEEYESRIVLRDKRVDLAVLKIDVRDRLPALQFADSDTVEVGDIVLAIGNPFGVGQTVTSGIVSALARNQVGVSDFGFFIQTDAAINPGNSGGALIDVDGALIGINTAIFSRSGGSNGIGFAIPSNMVRAVVNQAKSGADSFERPWIGATFSPVTAEAAEALGLRQPRGALVLDVVRDGPSDRAGLRSGDLVLALNGVVIEHPDALGYRLETAGLGSTVFLDVLSRGKRREIAIRLERAPESVPADERIIEGRNPLAGAVVANLSPRLAVELDLSSDATGVVILDIPRGAPAARYGFAPRDIVLGVNGEQVRDTQQLAGLVRNRANVWRFEIDRGGQRIRQVFR